MAASGGETQPHGGMVPMNRVAVLCPMCDKPMWTSQSHYRPPCWRCNKAPVDVLGSLPEAGSKSPYVPSRDHFRGPWFLREPYQTTDGRFIGMWCRSIKSGAGWYSGVDVAYYVPPDPTEAELSGQVGWSR